MPSLPGVSVWEGGSGNGREGECEGEMEGWNRRKGRVRVSYSELDGIKLHLDTPRRVRLTALNLRTVFAELKQTKLPWECIILKLTT